MVDLDVMLITHNRPAYTALSLPRLLETCPPGSRVWVWHNGRDREVLDVIAQYERHPRLHRVHRSAENVGLRPAMNWLWTEAEGTFVSKVDDDSLMEPGWVEHLSSCLSASPEFGVLGAWRFLPEDWVEERAATKTETMHGITLLRNLWVQGSGHMFRRALLDEIGILEPGKSFPSWCLKVAQRGYINGWPMPLVREEHLDDPRHPLTAFKDEASYQANLPLSALHTGATTLAEWLHQTKQDAYQVQGASLDLRQYIGWRRKLIHARRRVRKLATGKNSWN